MILKIQVIVSIPTNMLLFTITCILMILKEIKDYLLETLQAMINYKNIIVTRYITVGYATLLQ
jgi:hypothetical protein